VGLLSNVQHFFGTSHAWYTYAIIFLPPIVVLIFCLGRWEGLKNWFYLDLDFSEEMGNVAAFVSMVLLTGLAFIIPFSIFGRQGAPKAITPTPEDLPAGVRQLLERAEAQAEGLQTASQDLKGKLQVLSTKRKQYSDEGLHKAAERADELAATLTRRLQKTEAAFRDIRDRIESLKLQAWAGDAGRTRLEEDLTSSLKDTDQVLTDYHKELESTDGLLNR